MRKEKLGKQLVFRGTEMQEAAEISFLRQSLAKILSNAERYETQGNPFALIRKKALGSKEPFVVGYLTTDSSIMKEVDGESESNGQVVAFIHSRSSDQILIVTRDTDSADSKIDFENQDIKMSILPWPSIKSSEDTEQTRGIVNFLIEFVEIASAWDEFESNTPSVQDFIRDSFLKQEDLENLKFLNKPHLRF